MNLYQIDSHHFIEVENIRREMSVTEAAFDLLVDRFTYECKSPGIVRYRDMDVMPCKAAQQFMNWHMETSYTPSNALTTFCRDLQPFTKKIPKRALSRSLRVEIAYRQEYKCNKCKLFPIPPNFEVDHIIELQDGGQDISSNLQALCPGCHADKTRLNRLRKNRMFREAAQPKYDAFVGSGAPQVFSKYFSKNTL